MIEDQMRRGKRNLELHCDTVRDEEWARNIIRVWIETWEIETHKYKQML